jgi:Tfp pilus assembly protein PilO
MIPLLLAQASPDPAFMGALVVALIAITGWFFQYKRDRREEEQSSRPSPALHRQFVTREEFDRHVEEIAAQLVELRREGEDRVRRIHERMDKQTDRIIEVIRDQK